VRSRRSSLLSNSLNILNREGSIAGFLRRIVLEIASGVSLYKGARYSGRFDNYSST
jgi:hypothetical protein